MAVGGEASDLVQRAEAGVVCRPGDPVSIAGAVRQLSTMAPNEREALGRNGRRFYEENFAFALGVGQIEAVLESASRKT